MKENIHPAYGECKVTCACGEVFYTGSVKKEMSGDGIVRRHSKKNKKRVDRTVSPGV